MTCVTDRYARLVAEAGATLEPGVSPARARALAVLSAGAGARTADEVAAALGITAASARKHLDELVRRGVVEAESERSGRPGRPRIRYRAASPIVGAGAYERLAQLLLEVVATAEPPESVGQRFGAQVPPQDREAPTASLLRAMASEGFEPELVEADDGEVMVFHRCPYATAALANPGIVCALHRGFAEGVLGAGGAPGAVGALEVHDPRRAGCRLHLRSGDPVA
jgi:predicted ArsR family transcriptional regulator